MRESIKEKVKEQSKDPSTKSLRFVRGIPGTCNNPLCRSDFILKRKDQRFCGPKCKEDFFRVKYARLTLAPYFGLDPRELSEVTDGKD